MVAGIQKTGIIHGGVRKYQPKLQFSAQQAGETSQFGQFTHLNNLNANPSMSFLREGALGASEAVEDRNGSRLGFKGALLNYAA